MVLDRWVAALFAPLALWVLLNAFDDVVIDVASLIAYLRSRRDKMPGAAELKAVPERRMAIFVPLWKEFRVIQKMVEHNIAAQKYDNYDFFIGAYPNDPPTIEAVKEVVRRFPRAHMSVCPHDGPTSKADCLNWVYQRMLLHEEETGDRFDYVLIHDAEDLVHPEALLWINYYAQWNEMVQIPVLALPTKPLELTHGAYCDEFAEFQFKDMPARSVLGGFIPSNGVGTGFSRRALEALALAHSNQIFAPGCLTEDYEIGFRIHALGMPQKFVPIHRHNGSFVATREYFPRVFGKAFRQKSRWVIGIALQSWEMHGFRDTYSQLYFFWRDRKGLVSNLTTPFSNLLFLYGAVTWAESSIHHHAWGLAVAVHHQWMWPVCFATLSLEAFHMGVGAWCSAQVYGWVFASAAPIRVLWGNVINFVATVMAIRQYAWARIRKQPLRWLKTEHAYPTRAALVEHWRKIGEILVGSSYVSETDLNEALATQPPGVRIGEWLIQRGKLTLEELYEALALQQNVPLGKPTPEEISIAVTRTLPASVARDFSVLPFRVMARQLYVAGPELPDEATTKRIRDFCSLDIRFHLVTPREFEELAEEYIPARAK